MRTLCLISVLAVAFTVTNSLTAEDSFQLKDGDNVVLLGSSYIERLQASNYFETIVTSSQTKRKVTYRNLGWSGDTAGGISRAVFGSPKDGFERLKRDVLLAKPTVVVVNYGANEAYQGEAGLEEFKNNMNTLLNFLNSTKARIVLLAPHARTASQWQNEFASYNEKLESYTTAIQQIADDRGATFINPPKSVLSKTGAPEIDGLSDNGIHYTPYGYWATSFWLAKQLGEPRNAWRLTVDPEGKATADGVTANKLVRTETGVTFEAIDNQLPAPKPPRFSPRGAALLHQHGELKIEGLPEGEYGLQIDGKPIVRVDSKHWGLGVRFQRSYADEQVEALRTAIGMKNELFFHRYRPQNETYLFLFRKHEQGNNAVEIPQFDPLIAAKEKEIAKLKLPKVHTFKLVKLEKE